MVRIVLADDHWVVRQGLRVLMGEEKDFQIIGEATDGLEATRLVEQLKPDVLILDLKMSGVDGIEVARQVHKHSPQTKIVMLSMYGNENYVIEALRAGAKAYVLKEAAAEELVHAVRESLLGHRFLGSPLSEHAIGAYLQRAQSAVRDPYDTLTKREREVLHLAVEGYTNADIASRLFISRRTVEIHRANMMKKLGLRTQHIQLVQYAVQRGISPAGETSHIAHSNPPLQPDVSSSDAQSGPQAS